MPPPVQAADTGATGGHASAAGRRLPCNMLGQLLVERSRSRQPTPLAPCLADSLPWCPPLPTDCELAKKLYDDGYEIATRELAGMTSNPWAAYSLHPTGAA